jgi:hypothetical protein
MAIMSNMNLRCLDMDELGIEKLSVGMMGSNWVASGIGSEFYLLAARADVLVHLDYAWWVCVKRACLRCFTSFRNLRKHISALYELVFFRHIINSNIELHKHARALTLTNHHSNALNAVKLHIKSLVT